MKNNNLNIYPAIVISSSVRRIVDSSIRFAIDSAVNSEVNFPIHSAVRQYTTYSISSSKS